MDCLLFETLVHAHHKQHETLSLIPRILLSLLGAEVGRVSDIQLLRTVTA